MKPWIRHFYREASSKSPKEDGAAGNLEAGLFVLCDGVSGPYSPSNPGMDCGGGITSGQMVTNTTCSHVSNATPPCNIRNVLARTNKEVLSRHLSMGKNPVKEAVAGASVVACQVMDEEIKLISIGDCFALLDTGKGFEFFTNFDQAAFDLEDAGNKAFAECLEKAGGDKGKAWDLYFPYFADKQFFRANQNIGKGGHAVINGDMLAPDCWSEKTIKCPPYPKWILLGTDGLLTAESANPKNQDEFKQHLGNLYSKGGLPAVIEWRDKNDYLPHIGRGKWPEASAIELKF